MSQNRSPQRSTRHGDPLLSSARQGPLLTVAALLFAFFTTAAAADTKLATDFDKAVQPYTADGSFSGAVLVTQDGSVVFDRAYGMANRETQQPNASTISFHIGSLSRVYTATIVMMLTDSKRLWLDNTVSQLLPGTPGGNQVTVRNLLACNPATLAGHSAFNLLARIVEANTGEPFGDTANSDFFGPLWLKGSGIDTGGLGEEHRFAKGYVGDKSGEPIPAPPTDWTALAGDASVYATTRDELRWLNALFDDRLVTASSRQAMLAAGYGELIADSRKFGEPAYWQASRGYGFSSFVARLPARGVTVILFGNTDSDAAEQIGTALAFIAVRER